MSIIGLGKLGSPMAAVFAFKGFNVVGLDLNSAFVSAINERKAPVTETELQEYLNRVGLRLRATTDYSDAVVSSDVTFIIVPTPSGPDLTFSNAHLLAALKEIGQALSKKQGYHVVVVTSTVMPGSTMGELKACLERHSGRKVGLDVGLCYNPEFIALGSVIRDLLFPDMILIGESDEKSGQILEEIYKDSTESKPEIQRMSPINAEITKISINTFVTTKISYANMIADLCDYLPGADAGVVANAIGADSRIGRKYLKPAIGYGGPCFPRDNKAFAALGRKLGAHCSLAEATDQINAHQLARLSKAVETHARPSDVIAVLGLSYKPHTGIIEESQGVALANELDRAGYKVVVSDPQALSEARKALPASVVFKHDAALAVAQADLVVIATPWPQFAELPVSAFTRRKRRPIVIDPWRTVFAHNLSEVAQVVTMGTGAYGLAGDTKIERSA